MRPSRFDPDRQKPLPPTKAACMSALVRGPILGSWNGLWISEATGQEFNTHTVAWIVSQGWARFNAERTEARVTTAGREFERTMEVSPI
jgi:hypothetical protein